MSEGMTVSDCLTEMCKSMIDGGEEPGEFRVGRNAYNELIKCDCFLQGNPSTIVGIPIVCDERAQADMVYLYSKQMMKMLSRNIKTNSRAKKIIRPKWGFMIERKKEEESGIQT